MTYDVQVLRAILRLARRSEEVDAEALRVRAGGTRAEVRAALRRLAGAELVERFGAERARLTLAGLAVAMATLHAVVAEPRRAGRRVAERAA